MSIWFAWFQCDDVAELKSLREKLAEDAEKNAEELAAIDERIKKLEG